jgi:hypothetical protein
MKITLIVAMAFATACASSVEANPLQRLVPADAKSIEAKKMPGGSQLSFDAERNYPSSGVRREGIAELQKEGWRYCLDSSETHRWSTFLRGEGAAAERIYQRLSYLKKNGRLITIGERYVIKGTPSSGPKARPETKAQKVVIVDAVHNAKDVAELTAGTKCE